MAASGSEAWLDIVPRVVGASHQALRQPVPAWEWSLVLTAMGIEHTVSSQRGAWSIEVRPRDADRAVQEILLYERENDLEQGEAPEAAAASGGLEPTFWAFLGLAAFFKIVRLDLAMLGYSPVPWQALGSVRAEAVLRGEWWRTVTGLTLHGDVPHLLSNILIGSIFLVLVCRELGSGPGWFLVLLSGAAGNGLNALMQGPPHDAIGFSTAVFGSVGIIAGLRCLDPESGPGARRFLPVAAALGLLALLGTGGENTDLGAHLLGLACGFPLGLLAPGLRTHGFDREARRSAWLGWASAGLVLGSWACALLASVP